MTRRARLFLVACLLLPALAYRDITAPPVAGAAPTDWVHQ